MKEGETTRRELLRRAGGYLALGGVAGLAGWLMSRNDPCARPRACEGCRHRSTCARPPALSLREEDDHGG